MTILCFEGASAVGKTTTSRVLKDKHGAFVVPELIQLFERPSGANQQEEDAWYYDGQCKRWSLAMQARTHYGIVVLDGDIFQSLWYDWAFHFENTSFETVTEYYRRAIQGNQITFPDAYIILHSNEQYLRRRKEADSTRSRRNFEKHLSLVSAQKRYFQALGSISSSLVHFVEAVSVDENVDEVLSIAEGIVQPRNHQETLDIFDEIVMWVQENRP